MLHGLCQAFEKLYKISLRRSSKNCGGRWVQGAVHSADIVREEGAILRER